MHPSILERAGHGRTEADAIGHLKEQWEEACFLDEKALKMAQEGR